MKYSYSKCCWNWIYCWQIRDERLSRLQILLQGEIFTVWQFLSCKNFLDLPFWRHNTTAPKSSKIHEIRIWGVHQAFWSVHMKVGDLIVHENYLPSNRNQTERRNNEWFSFGSTLLYFPCYLGMEINRSMQRPNGQWQEYRVGQKPSLLGNLQIYIFRPGQIDCMCIDWPSKVAGKLKASTRNRIFESTKQQNEEIFCKTQHIWFHKHKAYSQWQEIRSELLFQTTLDGKLWICFSKLCQSVYGIFGIGSECDLFYCRLIN